MMKEKLIPIDNEDDIINLLFNFSDCQQLLTKEFIREILKDIKVFDRKNRDYGIKNISQFGIKGLIVRINDKLQRLINLVWNNKEASVFNETTYDTWQDLTIYSCISRMIEKKVWPE